MYIAAIAAQILAVVFSLLVPLIVKFTVDGVLAGQKMELPGFIDRLLKEPGFITVPGMLGICAAAVVIATLFQCLLSYFKDRWTNIAMENMAKRMKDALYSHIQNMPYDWHLKASTGDLIQRCTSDVETVCGFFREQLIEIGRLGFITVFSLCAMYALNRFMTAQALVFIPVVLIISYVFFKSIGKRFKAVAEKEGELHAVLQENLSGARVVRAFGRQKHEAWKFGMRNHELRALVTNVARLFAWFWTYTDVICRIEVIAILFTSIFLAVRGDITLGTMLVFNTYVNMQIWPMRDLGQMLSGLGRMHVSLGRVYEILDEPVEECLEERETDETELKGDIVFDGVCFGYEENRPILKDLSFTVKNGETIGILGKTGSGKSTLTHILLRLYDYTSGSITINGAELRHISKKWLRRRIGIVLQEPFLYSKTILENLRMSNHDAAECEIIRAAETAAIHKTIQDFEQGYETVVGENGATLSGGQKQRIAMARTLIKNSDILIFDDSLSAVDTETDARIRASLRERRRHVTTFIISQRISTLMETDLIFILEDGRLSDFGTHEELIARDGLYSRIWNIQSMREDAFDEGDPDEELPERT